MRTSLVDAEALAALTCYVTLFFCPQELDAILHFYRKQFSRSFDDGGFDVGFYTVVFKLQDTRVIDNIHRSKRTQCFGLRDIRDSGNTNKTPVCRGSFRRAESEKGGASSSLKTDRSMTASG